MHKPGWLGLAIFGALSIFFVPPARALPPVACEGYVSPWIQQKQILGALVAHLSNPRTQNLRIGVKALKEGRWAVNFLDRIVIVSPRAEVIFTLWRTPPKLREWTQSSDARETSLPDSPFPLTLEQQHRLRFSSHENQRETQSAERHSIRSISADGKIMAVNSSSDVFYGFYSEFRHVDEAVNYYDALSGELLQSYGRHQRFAPLGRSGSYLADHQMSGTLITDQSFHRESPFQIVGPTYLGLYFDRDQTLYVLSRVRKTYGTATEDFYQADWHLPPSPTGYVSGLVMPKFLRGGKFFDDTREMNFPFIDYAGKTHTLPMDQLEAPLAELELRPADEVMNELESPERWMGYLQSLATAPQI